MFSATCGTPVPFLAYPGPRGSKHSTIAPKDSRPSSEKITSGLGCLDRRCQYFDFHKELVPYKEAWTLQKALVAERLVLVDKDEDDSDMLIMLQHHPVYTLGTNGAVEFLKFDVEDAPFDIFRTERGGEVTYHGPGQLVMYPILNLRHHQLDLHWYLRSLEEVVIRALSSSFSIKASRVEGLTGVWVGDHKVAAIGIRVTRWITYHGLALNVDINLAPFQHIVPCGIRDRQVGSIKNIIRPSVSRLSEDSNLLEIANKSLLKEFSEVFQLALEPKGTCDVKLSFDRGQ